MPATTTFINDLLEAAFKGETYTGGTITMGLFRTGLPSTTGVEVSGGSYARQTLTFSAASAKAIATSSNVTFTGLPTGQTIVAYGIYDDATLIDEKLLTDSFTADVVNNTLAVSYLFEIDA